MVSAYAGTYTLTKYSGKLYYNKKTYVFLCKVKKKMWAQYPVQKSITRSTACAASVHLTGVGLDYTKWISELTIYHLPPEYAYSIAVHLQAVKITTHLVFYCRCFLFSHFFVTLQCVERTWRQAGMQIGLNINNQSHQINLNHHTSNENRPKHILILLFLLSL